MKKIIIVFVALGLVITSCKNDNVSNPQIKLGKATITGTLYADLNASTAGYEKAAGKTIVARVSQVDLVANPVEGINYGYKYYTATTDSNGKYSVEVEVRTDVETMSVKLVPQDFEVVVPPATTELTQFYGEDADASTTVYNGGTFLLDLYYND